MEVGDEGKWLDLKEIEPMFVPTGQDHMTFVHMTRLIRIDSTSTCNAISKRSRIHPSPLQRDVGVNQQGSLGWRNARGDPGSGPKRCVAKTGNDICCCPFFPFILPLPAANAC